MKKLIALILAVLMVIALAACNDTNGTNAGGDTGETASNGSDGGVIDGGFGSVESPVITEKIKTLVDKAAQDMDGASYAPVAYVAAQVVAGTNHLVLCKVTPVVPDAVSTYALVTIYEDLEGNAEIINVENSAAEAPKDNFGDEPMSGAYSEGESVEVTDEAKTALEKACETLTGVEYEPIALLATQVVAGMNYKLLCGERATVPGAQVIYKIVTVYADLSGNAEITETVDFGVFSDDTSEDGEQSASSQAE